MRNLAMQLGTLLEGWTGTMLYRTPETGGLQKTLWLCGCGQASTTAATSINVDGRSRMLLGCRRGQREASRAAAYLPCWTFLEQRPSSSRRPLWGQLPIFRQLGMQSIGSAKPIMTSREPLRHVNMIQAQSSHAIGHAAGRLDRHNALQDS